MGIVVDAKAKFEAAAAVVVIGAGGAGAMAALAARHAGAEVLVLDRDAAPGGATARSSGMIPAAGSSAQTAAHVIDTPQRYADDIQAKANGSADPRLVEAYTRQSAEVLDWLTRHFGLRFELVEGLAPGHSVRRMHALSARGGTTLLSALYSALGQAGVTMKSGARATDLVVDESHRVLGVRYERASGKAGYVGCRALVLASSGFAANAALVAEYLPDVRALPFAGHDGSQGDALVWGQITGASQMWASKLASTVGQSEPAFLKPLVHRHLAWLTVLRFLLRTRKVWENTLEPGNSRYLANLPSPESQSTLDKELAAYEMQKLFLDPCDYVVPPSVLRCLPLTAFEKRVHFGPGRG